MPILKIGIQTRSLRQPLRQALQTASQLGADGVEIDARSELPPGELSQTGVRQFRKLLADLRLGVSAVSFITRRGYENPDDLERRILATQSAMKFAQALGADVVINRAGLVPDGENDAQFASLIDVLSGLGAFGDRVGARLALQTGRESGPQLARLLAALPDQTIGVDFHPCGLIHHGHDPAEAVAVLARHVLHVHACDAVRDLTRGQVIDVELGRGTADLPAILGQLEEFNYRGWVSDRAPERARSGRRNGRRSGVPTLALRIGIVFKNCRRTLPTIKHQREQKQIPGCEQSACDIQRPAAGFHELRPLPESDVSGPNVFRNPSSKSKTWSKSSRRSLSVFRIWPMEIRLNTISPKVAGRVHAPMVEHALGQAAILLDRILANRFAQLLAGDMAVRLRLVSDDRVLDRTG